MLFLAVVTEADGGHGNKDNEHHCHCHFDCKDTEVDEVAPLEPTSEELPEGSMMDESVLPHEEAREPAQDPGHKKPGSSGDKVQCHCHYHACCDKK